LNIGVSYPFDVSVSDLFVPDLEGLGSKYEERKVSKECWFVDRHGEVRVLVWCDAYPMEYKIERKPLW